MRFRRRAQCFMRAFLYRRRPPLLCILYLKYLERSSRKTQVPQPLKERQASRWRQDTIVTHRQLLQSSSAIWEKKERKQKQMYLRSAWPTVFLLLKNILPLLLLLPLPYISTCSSRFSTRKKFVSNKQKLTSRIYLPPPAFPIVSEREGKKVGEHCEIKIEKGRTIPPSCVCKEIAAFHLMPLLCVAWAYSTSTVLTYVYGFVRVR